jgi:hypothetical protein
VQAQVLSLVNAYGHNVGLVEQNVCRHKSGVGEKTCIDVLRVLLALVLKLCHTGELAKHGVAIQHPAELCVRRHVGLNEKGVLLGVKAAGHIERKSLVGSATKLCRYLSYGNRVQVNYAVKGFIFLGEARKVLDRSEIVSNCKISRGLYSREYCFFIAVH